MDNNSNMFQLCRLCLVKDDVNIPIFEEQGDIRQIFLKISSCLPVKVSRDDQLPKKICDGCSYKLDMLYEFWNTSANAEKQLLTWLGEAGMTSQMADGTISAVAQQIKPADAFVKQETIDPPDIHMDDDDDEDKDYMKQEENSTNVEEPPPKRARRTAAVKAAIALDQNSDDDDDSGEPMTKIEDDSEDSDNDDREPAFVDVPSTSADDQPGPSGVGKDGVEAPWINGSSVTCIDCDKSFSTLQDMKTHIQNVEAFLKIYCKNCESFIPVDESSYHLTLSYSCAICKIILEEDILPTTHECFHEQSAQELATTMRVQCAVCNQVFFSTDDVDYHIKDKHFSGANLNCKCCKLIFKDEKELKQHLSEKHKKTLPVKKTEKKKQFRQQNKKMKNSNSEKWSQKKCSQCPLLFDNKKDYLAHKRRAHEIFLCYICGRKMHINFLRTHLDMHENNKRYKCNFCDKRFRLPGTLRNHQMIHSNESNYQCQVCGKGFKKAYNLKVHMRIHSPVKPFECVICKKTFTTKQSRDNHLKTHK